MWIYVDKGVETVNIQLCLLFITKNHLYCEEFLMVTLITKQQLAHVTIRADVILI